MERLYAEIAGTFSIHRYELVNPRVCAAGSLAVLTYNLVNYVRDADGNEKVLVLHTAASV